MKRVTSRQRLAYHNAFEAAVVDDDSDYETCYESSLSRPSSFVSLPLALDRSASMESFSPLNSPENETTNTAPRRKRVRDDLHPSVIIKKNVSFSSLVVQTVEAPPQLVPAYDFEIGNESPFPAFCDLMDDVKLHVMSFLTASDARSVSATCHELRQLIFSEDGYFLWKEWCLHQWPTLSRIKSTEESVYRDDFSLPTALGSFATTLGPNLSLLLGMASLTQPTKIDETLFSSTRSVLRRIPRLNNLREQETTEKRVQFRTFVLDDLPVVQFTGAVGTGDRCIRSDQPLASPKLVIQPTHKWTFPPSPTRYMEGGIMMRNSKHSILDIIRGYPQVSAGWWRPFVAPYVTRSRNGQHEVHLTPRMVSYYEVSILERNESQEPPLDVPEATTYAADCVAVGVSSGVFHLHSKMPGWDSFSYGYHGDDGGIFHASGEMIRRFGPRFGTGDTVGCGIDFTCRGIFFTRNGEFLGYAWTDIDPEFLKHHDMYPTVGVDTNCPIACNFGERPFEFDMTPLIKSHGEIVERSLSTLTAVTGATTIRSRPPHCSSPIMFRGHA